MAGLADSEDRYAELHCLTNFSFLRGASHPEELVEQAIRLNYSALAITDECSVSGVVRAFVAARGKSLQILTGSEFNLKAPHTTFILLAMNRTGYGQLCQVITDARRRAVKGHYDLQFNHLDSKLLSDCLAIWVPTLIMSETANTLSSGSLFGEPKQILCLQTETGQKMKALFPDRLWLGAQRSLTGRDEQQKYLINLLAEQLDLPIVATGNVHMHIPQRKKLQDTLTAIRLNTTVQKAGSALHSNHEQYLRPQAKLKKLFPAQWLSEARNIAARCTFSLDSLRYEYPSELVPVGMQADAYLKQLVDQGTRQRYPQGQPLPILRQIRKELDLIRELKYAHYFLTIYDIVQFAKKQGILCQGRGSAANSIVCYCLGITEVDPTQVSLLFERFISRERNEPPDIDVDFEHERREEVIQYIYQKYGRHRAGLAATIITYRGKSAIRDVGKALGIDLNHLEHLIASIDWRDKTERWPEQLAQMGDQQHTTARLFAELVSQILGFPRHLSQHVGGFVISSGHLSQLVPIENAAMSDRTVIQWDKDDLEALGLLKVDILALGMLSAIRKCLKMIRQYQGFPTSLAEIPKEDPAVYRMLQKADSIGVFQVESRAQSSMLPRLKPASYYDLVIQVAIVRPGPIQGDMVHPYLRRRNGQEAVSYPNKEIQQVLQRTLGVPIFQEQVIKLAMVAAGFTAGEADQLRRAMANWKRNGKLKPFQDKLIEGMTAKGHSLEFAERICRQISGFGEYGFPESHAASFALLVYVSAWLKCYHPAAFCCGLLNSLPMGFYSPSQLIQDAQRHQITVLPVDINHSVWDHEPAFGDTVKFPSIRLGFRLVRQLREHTALGIIHNRPLLGYSHLAQLRQLAGLSSHELEVLASADALSTFSGHRYQVRWQIRAQEPERPLLQNLDQDEISEPAPPTYIPTPTEAQSMQEDFYAQGLSVTRHPMALLRKIPNRENAWLGQCLTTAQLEYSAHKSLVSVVGIVTGRQRPGSASGVTFVTLEDEFGHCNVVVWLATARAQRKALIRSKLLQVTGILEKEEGVIHLIAGRLTDRTAALHALYGGGDLRLKSRDFH